MSIPDPAFTMRKSPSFCHELRCIMPVTCGANGNGVKCFTDEASASCNAPAQGLSPEFGPIPVNAHSHLLGRRPDSQVGSALGGLQKAQKGWAKALRLSSNRGHSFRRSLLPPFEQQSMLLIAGDTLRACQRPRLWISWSDRFLWTISLDAP